VALRFKSLGSGSAGNGTLVQSLGQGKATTLLVDCGFGLGHLKRRLGLAGLGTEDLSALFITHEHGDHVGCAVALAQKENIPLWMSAGTYLGIGEPPLGSLLHLVSDLDVIEVDGLFLQPFTVPHDAREPLQLCCTDGQSKLGILTDIGHSTPHVIEALQNCNALLLECNHDAALLAASRYPPFLKNRISGRLGHLENNCAQEIARLVRHAHLNHVVAAHLSERNNRPELAAQCLAQGLDCDAADIVVASAEHGTPWFDIA
jgi:phosphoribosyl 1,2-cyclic phosphodiesterase